MRRARRRPGQCRHSRRPAAHGAAGNESLHGLFADAFLPRLTLGQILPHLLLRALRHFLQHAFREHALADPARHAAGESRLPAHRIQCHRRFGVLQSGNASDAMRDGAGDHPGRHLQQIVAGGRIRLLGAKLLGVLSHRQHTLSGRAGVAGDLRDLRIGLRLRHRPGLHRRVYLWQVARQHLLCPLGNGLHAAIVLGDESHA